MKYLLLGLISPVLLLSLSGCVTNQSRSIYIYTTKKYCPFGFILMTDNTCRPVDDLNKAFIRVKTDLIRPTKVKPVKRAKKYVKKDRVINCKQVMSDINKCMGESVY